MSSAWGYVKNLFGGVEQQINNSLVVKPGEGIVAKHSTESVPMKGGRSRRRNHRRSRRSRRRGSRSRRRGSRSRGGSLVTNVVAPLALLGMRKYVTRRRGKSRRR